MNISSVPISSSSSAIPSYETQIQMLEAREKNHQEQISKLNQNKEDEESNKQQIGLLETQIELMKAQIERIKSQERLQKVETKKDNKTENKEDKSSAIKSIKSDDSGNEIDILV